jgi:hypothetical protein
MTIDDLKEELMWLLQDPTVEHNMSDLIADERLSFAAEYELPRLKLDQPVSGTVTTANWLYDLPSTYQKKVFKARNSQPDGQFLPIYRDIAAIDAIDHDHDETGDFVEMIAVEGEHFAIYPKANNVIYLFFYKKPDIAGDITEVEEEWIHRVLVPRIVLRCFRLLPELARDNVGENTKALDYWRVLLREGLYGSKETGGVGFVHTMLKSNPPRVHGGHQHLP